MGFFSSIGDIFSDVVSLGASAFTDALSVLGKVATGDIGGAFTDAFDNLVQSNKDMVASTFQVLPYVAAVVGYIYGGPVGATTAYNLAGGEGMGSSIEKQSPSEWAATVASAYTGGEDGMMGQVIAMGFGILGPDEGGDGSTFAGQDLFSDEVVAARLSIVEAVYRETLKSSFGDWRKLQPNYEYQSTHTGGADADPDEANHTPYNLSNDPSLSFGRYVQDYTATHGVDLTDMESMLGADIMKGTPLGDAYLEIDAMRDAAIIAAESGVPGLTEPVDPDRGDNMYVIGGEGEAGGSVGDNILSGIDSILGLVGGEQQDINVTTTTNIQLPSEPAKMPSIRELDNLDQGLFAPGPLVRAKRKVDVARASTAPAPVKSMWNKSGIGITG